MDRYQQLMWLLCLSVKTK
uniref:Uncharacterized protein n=1 Tax=Rhizophora mucronata TaxID=61149 RepID=A0A2P2QJ89_RHIMU